MRSPLVSCLLRATSIAIVWGGCAASGGLRADSEDVCATAPVAGFGFDRFGGWKGVELPSAPRFRVEQVDGVWWFVTPDGHVLFSNGPAGIGPIADTIQGTDHSPHLDAVLEEYGNVESWADSTVARLCQLSIRTHGGWMSMADVDLFTGRIPYTVNTSFYAALPEVSGAPQSIKPRRDVFDPSAPERARTIVADPAGVVRRCAGDPWCIGVYVENELPWGPTVTAGGTHLDVYLAQPPGAPGKQALQRFFEQRYAGDLSAFDRVWGASLTSFDELQGASSLGSCPPLPARSELCQLSEPSDRFADRMAFEAEVAGRAAELAASALAEVDPLLLDLGPRITLEPHHEEVLRALAGPADVMTVNDYDVTHLTQWIPATLQARLEERGMLPLDPFERLTRVHEVTGKPVLVSEWFCRVHRDDLPPGASSYPPLLLPEVADAETQALEYQAFADQILAMPFAVGEHWFQWVDQPREGRFDGENQRIGVVDIEDRLNQPLADTMATVNAGILERRLDLRRPNRE